MPIAEILMKDDGSILAVVRKTDGVTFEMVKPAIKKLERLIGVAVKVKFEEPEEHLKTHDVAVLEVNDQRVNR